MDERLRELERAWREGGEVEAGRTYLAALERAGQPTDELRRELLRAQLAAGGVDVGSLEPYPAIPDGPVCLLTIPGGEPAVATWRAIRALHAETGYWPVLIGQVPEELELLEEFMEGREPLAAILEEVALAGTEAGHEAERERRRAVIAQMQGFAASSSGSGAAAMREYVAELERELARVGQPPPPVSEAEPELVGPWPDGVEPATTFQTPFDVLTREPHPQVGMLLLPTADPDAAPAWLRFGQFNACPRSAEHVVRFRSWRERYGAEVVAITHDVVELTVARPPTTRAEALELAWEQFRHCDDIVHQGTRTLSNLAAALLGGTTWYFWWD